MLLYLYSSYLYSSTYALLFVLFYLCPSIYALLLVLFILFVLLPPPCTTCSTCALLLYLHIHLSQLCIIYSFIFSLFNMLFLFVFIQLLQVAISTPPACFLSCINEVAHMCPRNQADIGCLCAKQAQVIGCLVDICPYGTFEASRDHYFGTCLEHEKPTYGNYPPDNSNPVATKTKPIITSAPTRFPSTATSAKPTKTKTITRTTSTSGPIATETRYYNDNDEEECDDKPNKQKHYQTDYDDCEWVEEQTTESDGTMIIIRKPIRVADKYLKSPYTDSRRRRIIIKRPKKTSYDNYNSNHNSNYDFQI